MVYTRQHFINKLAPYAVDCMKRTSISAALTIAQGCLESANGNSGLAVQANNLFGIKGLGDKGSIKMLTREQRKDGSEYVINASFAAYSSWGACVEAKAALFLNGVSWNRSLYLPLLGRKGKEAARAVQACGYATDLNYADKLIAIMDAYNLYPFDDVEVEEAMNQEEKAAFEELCKQVKDMKALLDQKDPPAWAQMTVDKLIQLPNKKGSGMVLSDRKGDYSFMRILVMLDRMGLFER
ncbi:mannosyl-glycoprotein endo-beta-N-acetylglucosamidase [Paenibacillus sambharensis]|uniref:Mannosyl-glycoprotein endo-beta-N-acetylglucosamidase n=1 Tax=Paenibacillus sambharensis TaxID=1803190 RepID=A0A2W1LXI7_9BACL|nr:glucosaminidase domain-containing protein [Paenibacillus sambharensis]PZD96411.1 mannosyl-glycoprotein endo-beta-N-acetylglucosamidase [Paenibacillus sambharensis]